MICVFRNVCLFFCLCVFFVLQMLIFAFVQFHLNSTCLKDRKLSTSTVLPSWKHLNLLRVNCVFCGCQKNLGSLGILPKGIDPKLKVYQREDGNSSFWLSAVSWCLFSGVAPCVQIRHAYSLQMDSIVFCLHISQPMLSQHAMQSHSIAYHIISSDLV